jgi:hypothetical protein
VTSFWQDIRYGLRVPGFSHLGWREHNALFHYRRRAPEPTAFPKSQRNLRRLLEDRGVRRKLDFLIFLSVFSVRALMLVFSGIGVAVLLTGVALLAYYIPARRATHGPDNRSALPVNVPQVAAKLSPAPLVAAVHKNLG